MSLDPAVLITQLTAEAGNAIATFVLGKDGAGAVKGLTDLAAALPQIPLGKISPFQMGVIAGELQVINGKATAAGAGSALLAQLGSAIDLVAQSEAAASGGNITPVQALLSAAGQNIANGILNAIAFFQGSQSVLNPAPAPAPTPAPASS